MPVFTKKSHNHFDVDHFEVDNSFGFRITVDGDYFAFAGMSLGDLVTINQHIAEAIELGVSEQAISDKFHGRSNFTLRDVSRIADFFDVSTDLVLGREPLEV